jgi:hypothetical protein
MLLVFYLEAGLLLLKADGECGASCWSNPLAKLLTGL